MFHACRTREIGCFRSESELALLTTAVLLSKVTSCMIGSEQRQLSYCLILSFQKIVYFYLFPVKKVMQFTARL